MTESEITQIAEETMARARELQFFDANVWLGFPEGFPLAEELDEDSLGQVLKRRFVTGGLVSHWRGKRCAQEGNEALLRAVGGRAADLYITWTGLPLFPQESGELPGFGEPPGEVRGVRIFPKTHAFPLVDWCIGSLCHWLVTRRMPLFVWHTEIDWQALYSIAKAFPGVSFVVETQVQKILYHTRPLFAVMRDCQNVFVEISNFAGQGFVEYAAKEFGAERLIFGSFLPANDPLVAIGMVVDAAISQEEKVLIAGDNLRRICGLTREVSR